MHILTNEWRPIPCFTQYEIHPCGQIRRCIDARRGPAKSGAPSKTRLIGGYNYINLWDGSRYVQWRMARLMLTVFVGPPPSGEHDAAHDDGCATNDSIGNLLWKTKVENQRDRWRHGTRAWGEAAPGAKLTYAKADDIRIRTSRGEPVRALAREFGVNRWVIKNIASGKSWRDKSMEAQA